MYYILFEDVWCVEWYSRYRVVLLSTIIVEINKYLLAKKWFKINFKIFCSDNHHAVCTCHVCVPHVCTWHVHTYMYVVHTWSFTWHTCMGYRCMSCHSYIFQAEENKCLEIFCTLPTLPFLASFPPSMPPPLNCRSYHQQW